MIPPPPRFSVPPSRAPKALGVMISAAICGLLAFGLQHPSLFWNIEGAPAPLPHRFRLTVDLAEPIVEGNYWEKGRLGPTGGSLGTNTVDPLLLSLKKVEVPSVNLDTVLPLSQRDPIPTFAGEATLPWVPGGDGNPSGHGFGFGYGTGDGIGEGGNRKAKTTIPQPAQEWGVMKKVKANYPQRALKFKIQGYVVVLVTIDENGVPIKVKPVKGNDILMAEALRVVMLWRFEQPARYGISAPASFPVVHKFELININPE